LPNTFAKQLKMVKLFINTYSKPKQFLYSFLLVCVVAGTCYALSGYLDYRVVAFILLVAVSLTAMFFDILPVLFSALLTALIWDYFFIPPHFTFNVRSTEDGVLLLTYFIVALVNAALTYKIRQVEKLAIQKEEKANTLKLYNTLFNSLSHELRTPIAAIIGATDNLQTNNERLTLLDKQELIDEIAKASFRLNQQVDNLLNMSRLESGFIQPKMDWCDINEMIYDLVKRVEENNPNRKIDISIDPELPLFKLDKGILEQVVYNLLNNASQYTAEQSTIEICVTCAADILKIIIGDNGNGFPPDEINKVFDKFYRLKNSKAGGTGLGLSIVKGFTEALGGQVNLENREEGGAKFTIQIAAETSYLKNLNNG
jgi:two-component system sensor histidine kinase KdpD